MAELTPEEIKREQERLELLQKQNEAVRDLTVAYNALGKLKGKLSESDKEAINLAKTLTDISKSIETSVNKRLSGTATVKDLSKQLNQLEQDKILLSNKSAVIEAKINADRTAALAAARQKAQEENKLKRELQSIDEQITTAEIARQVHLQNGNAGLAKQAADEAKALQYNAKLKEKKIDAVIKEKEAQKELVKQLDKEKEAHEQIKKQLDEEIEKTRETQKQAQKQAGIDMLKKGLRLEEIEEMFSLYGIIKLIIDGALRFNAISVETGKHLAYGTAKADQLTNNFVDIAQHSTNLNVTLKNLGEAMGQLNEATGGVAEYSADTLETQIILTKQLGLSGEEAAGIYKFSVLTGKASSVINEEMAGAFASTRNMTKGSADFKATMAEVAKVSGQLAINFQNNPSALTRAVVQAQALGTTLEKTKSQGEKLLDFESSIESELKAELLTGQQMNLERARAAALQGDQVTVMKELANQGMTLNKFQNMNVIAQKSFAEALGLSADELSDQLRKQKIAQEQGKSLAQITKEEALEAEQRQAIQDKFNAAMDKLKDIIGNLVAGPLGSLLDTLSNVLQVVGWIMKPFMLIKDAIAWIVNKLDKIAGIGGIIRNVMKFTMPALAPTAGSTKDAGDVNSPSKGKTQISTKEGGLFELSKNDDLVAFPGASNLAKKVEKKVPDMTEPKSITSPTALPSTTNIAKGAEKITEPNMTEPIPAPVAPAISIGANKVDENKNKSNLDITPLLEEFRAFIAEQKATTVAVNKLYAKDTSIHMDGKKVGTTLSQNSHKVA